MSESTKSNDHDRRFRLSIAGMVAGAAIASVLFYIGGIVVRMIQGSTFSEAISSIDAVGSAASVIVFVLAYLVARKYARR